ncbi:MAG: hypothetical protein JXK94_02110 [Deltaproteobacteria bacterium]|nr:hypothetical protein [Deltaproteobacteria bacterium]
MRKYPEFLADIAAQNTQLLIKRGMDEKQAVEIGCEVAEFFRNHWGGVSIYVPKACKFEQSVRDREIFEEFNGYNKDKICRKYDISYRHFYTIINSARLALRAKPARVKTGVFQS